MAEPDAVAAARWVRLALEIGAQLAQLVVRAIQAGDTSTLDALHAILPGTPVLAARDEALRIEQRRLAAEALRGSRR